MCFFGGGGNYSPPPMYIPPAPELPDPLPQTAAPREPGPEGDGANPYESKDRKRRTAATKKFNSNLLTGAGGLNDEDLSIAKRGNIMTGSMIS